MPKTGLLTITRRIFCAACFALAVAWPSEGAQAGGDSTDKQRVVAVGRERIECGRREVRVLRGDQPVVLPRFTELLVATAVEREADLEKLSGQHVAIVKSLKMRDQWEVHVNVVWGGTEFALPENVFEVKRVVSSSAEAPVEVHVNGKSYRLRPGQVVLVLG